MTDKAQATARRKIRMAQRQVKLHLPAPLPSFFALVDPHRTPDPLALAERLPPGTGVIYRHFGEAKQESIGQGLVKVARARSLMVLIGNDPQLARRLDADGVHWAEARRHEARGWRDRFAIMTCAAHSRRSLARAGTTSCDAALYSTVFASNSPSASAPMGALRFRNSVQRTRLPVYALGGVNADTIGQISSVAGGAAIEGASVFLKASQQ